ncbi:MAG: hypothetical protein JO297_05665 [Nitrososphaeraceae archaeon]|nr:hypothetical protein [Nitrososphaeraceae archaeon]
MTSNEVLQDKAFINDIVTKCLTDKCEECTGSYINRILDHRFTCKCPCGHAKGADA